MRSFKPVVICITTPLMFLEIEQESNQTSHSKYFMGDKDRAVCVCVCVARM